MAVTEDQGMIRRLLRLAYLLAQHPFHAHRWLVDRGLVQGWVKDFAQFWDTVRPPGVPVTDYTSFQWLNYHYAAKFRERHPEGDRFDDPDAERSRLFGYILRRERHPLRCLMQAWHLRGCSTVLEFGAGSAPYAHFIQTAWPLRQRVYVVDLDGLLKQYQRWRGFEERTTYTPRSAGIVCTEVFEHLPDPVWTAQTMIDAAPIVVFDYVDDGSPNRTATLATFRAAGVLTGPDARGLYVWQRR